MKRKVHEPCTFCNGTGKQVKRKEIRIRCDECQDHNHGCFGSGRADGLGNKECTRSEEVFEEVPPCDTHTNKLMGLTREQAHLLCSTHEIFALLEDEYENLRQHNPDLLEAYCALHRIASGAPTVEPEKPPGELLWHQVMTLAERRDKLCKSVPPCPECKEDKQIQLTHHLTTPAGWKCRKCHYRWEFEPK